MSSEDLPAVASAAAASPESQPAPDSSVNTVESVPATAPTEESGSTSASGSAKTTLWMGELEPWFDESSIKKIWATFSLPVEVKMIRDKFSGVNAGYCFVDFRSSDAAATALQLNGQYIPNTQRLFRLNWASGNGINDRKEDRPPEFSIFVGDLSADVTEADLLDLFTSRYPSCKSTKIMCDITTNQSRGYGFVRFSDESEMQRALQEMQGQMCGSRPMRISTATPKNKGLTFGHYQQMQQQMAHLYYSSAAAAAGTNPAAHGAAPAAPVAMNQFTDPHNTTVFVGGLAPTVSEEELRSYFASFGEITYVKIPPGKGCGFVQYMQRLSAEQAIAAMQGYSIGNSRVRLSWGRSTSANGPPNSSYRQAPPPLVYPHHQVPATHPYDGSLTNRPALIPAAGVAAPFSPSMVSSTPQAAPAATTPGSDPTEPLPMARLNELYEAARLGTIDRLQGNDKFNGVYAQ